MPRIADWRGQGDNHSNEKKQKDDGLKLSEVLAVIEYDD